MCPPAERNFQSQIILEIYENIEIYENMTKLINYML